MVHMALGVHGVYVQALVAVVLTVAPEPVTVQLLVMVGVRVTGLAQSRKHVPLV